MRKRSMLLLFLLSLATLGLALLVFVAIQVFKWIGRKLQGHWGVVMAVIGGLLITMISAGFYLVATIDLERARATVDIKDARFYIDNGLLTSTHYMRYLVLPTNLTESDTVYQLEVGNGIVGWKDKVYWTQLELDVRKPKAIKNKINQDEYNALGMNPNYVMDVKEVKSERSAVYLALPFLYIGVMLVVVTGKKQGYNDGMVSVSTRSVHVGTTDYDDIVEVLRSQFGYRAREAKEAASFAVSGLHPTVPLEEKIRQALKYLGGGNSWQ